MNNDYVNQTFQKLMFMQQEIEKGLEISSEDFIRANIECLTIVFEKMVENHLEVQSDIEVMHCMVENLKSEIRRKDFLQ
ncbi:hypothetical protein SAMN05192533_102287 [Mesobacillus persicus]|uniref:Phage protein n=1 Tax=Mesobacillus persicus TaxID=930146 RepID=A0A1H7XNB8_9BACI|nr:hypothetical protein [Mesobacillus persicus]SEM35231.1 hypothetical protein SAMN05192533_102287 [Mesobacillus persicus]